MTRAQLEVQVAQLVVSHRAGRRGELVVLRLPPAVAAIFAHEERERAHLEGRPHFDGALRIGGCLVVEDPALLQEAALDSHPFPREALGVG